MTGAPGTEPVVALDLGAATTTCCLQEGPAAPLVRLELAGVEAASQRSLRARLGHDREAEPRLREALGRDLGLILPRLSQAPRQVIVPCPTSAGPAPLFALRRASAGLPVALRPVGAALCVAAAWLQSALERGSVHTLRAVLPPPAWLVVLDAGASGCDAALVLLDLREEGVGHVVRLEPVASAGGPRGDDVTLALFHAVKVRLALACADAALEPGAPPEVPAAPLSALAAVRDELRERVERGWPLSPALLELVDAVLPTRFAGRSGPEAASRRARFAELWDLAERLARWLSGPDGPSEVGVDPASLPCVWEVAGLDPDRLAPVPIPRELTEQALREPLELALEQLRAALPPGAAPAAAVLAGGVSQHPALARSLEQAFGLGPDQVHLGPDAYGAAAGAAALLARERWPRRPRWEWRDPLAGSPWELLVRRPPGPARPWLPAGAPLPSAPTPLPGEGPVEVLWRPSGGGDPLPLARLDDPPGGAVSLALDAQGWPVAGGGAAPRPLDPVCQARPPEDDPFSGVH